MATKLLRKLKIYEYREDWKLTNREVPLGYRKAVRRNMRLHKKSNGVKKYNN